MGVLFSRQRPGDVVLGDVTPANASGFDGGAGQERRAADQAGGLFFGRPVVVHEGIVARGAGQIQS